MTANPDEIVTKLIEKEAAIKRENRLAPEALLFAKKRGKGGDGGEAGEGARSPKKDKRDDEREHKNDRKEKDFRKCFHCKQREHTTEN